MTTDEFEDLLDVSETTWLDWKKDLPAGVLGGKAHPEWNAGRAEMIKDIAAIANGEDGRPRGYLIYGVRDFGSSRKVFGTSKSLDDAILQTWAKNHFDPVPRFAYSELLYESCTIAVVEINRVPQYPHVVVQPLGDVISKGQVWYRVGSSNDVALSRQLREMFRGNAPMLVDRTDGKVIADLKLHYEPLGLEIVLPLLGDRDEKLRYGYEIAYYPGTRREVWAGLWNGRHEHLVMLRKRA